MPKGVARGLFRNSGALQSQFEGFLKGTLGNVVPGSFSRLSIYRDFGRRENILSGPIRGCRSRFACVGVR